MLQPAQDQRAARGRRRRPAGRVARHHRPDRAGADPRRRPRPRRRWREYGERGRKPPGTVKPGAYAPSSPRRRLVDSPDLRTRCLAIDLLVLDVDGVLTDGGIIYGDDGTGAEAVPRPRRLGPEDLAVRRQALRAHHRAALAGGRGAGGGAGHRFGDPGGGRQAAGLPRPAAGRRLAPRAGLLRRRRPAGPAAAAQLRPGRRGGRRLPRGVADAHYVTGAAAAAARFARPSS